MQRVTNGWSLLGIWRVTGPYFTTYDDSRVTEVDSPIAQNTIEKMSGAILGVEANSSNHEMKLHGVQDSYRSNFPDWHPLHGSSTDPEATGPSIGRGIGIPLQLWSVLDGEGIDARGITQF